MRAWLLGVLLLFSPSAQAADRILAMAPHVCEMLYAIGAGDEIVGAVDYCDFPTAARKLPRIGSYTGINLEAALRLKPTLAIISGTSNQQSQLEALGMRVIKSAPQSVEAVMDDIIRLGRVTGHTEQAEAVTAMMRKRLQRLEQRSASQPVRVFYEIWHDPLQTVGGNGFIEDMLQRAGLENVFASLPLETPRVNLEAVLRAAPEVVIIPSEHRDVAARRKFWKQWLGDQVRIVVVNPDLMHRPGPRVIDGLEALQQALEEAGETTR